MKTNTFSITRLLVLATILALCGATNDDKSKGPGWTGDPVFVGFDKESFDFFGKAGSSYTVLSTDNLTVNVEMVAAGPEYKGHSDDVEGTFVGGMSVLLSSFELYAHVDVAGNMTIFVNGLELDIELPARFNQGLLTYEPYRPEYGQVITIQQQPFRLAFVAVKQLSDEVTGFNRGHFEMQADLLSPAKSGAKGILGGTLGLKVGEQASREAAVFEIPSLSTKVQAVQAA